MKNFAFTRTNYILIAIGMAVVILGFILMSGTGSDETTFNADIFSGVRIKLAPAVAFLGFVVIGVGIMFHGKEKQEA